MSANDITKNSIDTYFSQLAKELKKEFGRNANIELVVVGGAAVMLNYDFREATKDIDALITARSSIKDVINRIGDKFGLQNGWINSDFKNTKSYSPQLIQYSKYHRTYNQVLTVRTIDAEYLIAMKLASFREYKNDRSDVAGILSSEKGKEIDFDRITQAVDKLYGGWKNMPEGTEDFVKDCIRHRSKELYENLKSMELGNKEILVSFEQKYDNVLNESNLSDILQNIKSKQKSSEQSFDDFLKDAREQADKINSQNQHKNKDIEKEIEM